MARHILILAAITLVTLLFAHQFTYVLHILQLAHDTLAAKLGMIFSGGSVGQLIREEVALLLIPIVAGGIVALAYWIVKRSIMPYLAHVVWVLWIMLTTSLILH